MLKEVLGLNIYLGKEGIKEIENEIEKIIGEEVSLDCCDVSAYMGKEKVVNL